MEKKKRGYKLHLTGLGHEEIVARAQPWPQKRAGVYFLIYQREVMYVGQSTDVFARVAQHARTRTFTSWHWIPYKPEQLLERARAFIRRLAPRWNEAGVWASRRGADGSPEPAADVATDVATGNFRSDGIAL